MGKAPVNAAARAHYREGLRAGVPVIFGFIPVGIAYALIARQAGFSARETVFMSLSVFAGASQMMACGMYARGAGTLAIILATFILNLRHLIMSTCVMERLAGAPVWQRLLAAFGVTDESFALFTACDASRACVPYFLGMITVTYTAWVGGSALGACTSGFMPEILTLSFGVALYAMFIALTVPQLRGNMKLVMLVAATALCNTLLTRVMAASWALIISTLACAGLGALLPDAEAKRDAR